MSKAERDDEEYFHECAQCSEVEDCAALEWQACEGKGALWFCSEECAEAYEVEQQREREDEAHREDERINEDDPREDR
ncbi:MAG: hypothetical protein WC120_05260 [Parcubacteria group bacterium]|jgi:hypothetical protein